MLWHFRRLFRPVTFVVSRACSAHSPSFRFAQRTRPLPRLNQMQRPCSIFAENVTIKLVRMGDI
ncbi:MAG: hypothetical protein AVDCRST_MAG93-9457 [uncultured Chloroflexia bacterium]|uniref:Uncharacterized protein n=1 Tax=uncultured Chloroflexia bacterium TaxID=1672391 RepID=A0A6J4NEZ9_9CHLR|nr:MAG: hypothetical protein AVDCRST_MAG93-9457 [uncultured Chloroflexia bacterium]